LTLVAPFTFLTNFPFQSNAVIINPKEKKKKKKALLEGLDE
jgi:hypothetical protein